MSRSSNYEIASLFADFLRETADAVAKDYGDKLDVRPIAGDYSVGISEIR